MELQIPRLWSILKRRGVMSWVGVKSGSALAELQVSKYGQCERTYLKHVLKGLKVSLGWRRKPEFVGCTGLHDVQLGNT
jgi:hypothetical protein